MTTEHGHSPDEIANRLSQGTRYSPLKDMIYGGIDGAVTTFAIVAGVEGAGLSHSIIVALGLANILADGFSMAASNYSGTKAELDDRKRIIQIEERHIADHPAAEREELRQILAMRGLSGPILEQATDAIVQRKEKWIGLMLTDEYGLARDDPHPLHAALATFAAFLTAGAVPLTPFVFGLANPFALSVCATLFAFFLIGAAKSRWSLSKWWRSGTETLFIGGMAALLAYIVGGMFHPG
ncbi:VIT1/CCC1 transporter family protein [Octadecabacter sp. G9-8]|uniref:VIT1/CCC1 transporter family protein n=1 Tax=Octadecabacter dasysiphoniae TaxID=2909341 RepID=A0ABS9CT26_9RHOB|nr:VIT1/CCC1 transporter family protein [Octadecabacter dasysiphoniae]MCF2870398.1 VIT1/CCC1 transporter family protein [Octadecabacter dasysiphoniae]